MRRRVFNGGLEYTGRNGRQPRQHLDVLGGTLLEIVRGPDAVGPAPVEGLLRVQVPARHHDLERPPEPNDAGQEPRRSAIQPDGARHAVVTDLGVAGDEPEVAGASQLEAVAERPPVDQRDYRLRQFSDRRDQLVVDRGGAVDARLRVHPLQVVSGTKRHRAMATNGHDPNLRRHPRVIDQLMHLAQ